jgi:hypothetical protein
MLKHKPYSVAITFKGMSSDYHGHVYKIEELNYKKGWWCMFLEVVHLGYDIIQKNS